MLGRYDRMVCGYTFGSDNKDLRDEKSTLSDEMAEIIFDSLTVRLANGMAWIFRDRRAQQQQRARNSRIPQRSNVNI
jgi:hypothetical protein